MNTDKTYAEAIASEYAPKETSKIVQLKKLDQRAKLPANIFGYGFGIAMTLVLGTGMSLCLKAIGPGTPAFMVLGIFIGIIGLVGCGINYPIYLKLLEKGKKKYAFEIVELAKEITEEAD